ncbi:Mammalian cell entry related domain protein [Mycolicibacterium rhodesiae JS60]|nr:Mammalian cell entry related domain protein [Mycolicibacterium rhodesiae JS60]
MTRSFITTAYALICAVAISSCAAISVNDLPQPGNSYSDGYDVVIEFANVLNLPDRAKVVMDGTAIGVVERTELGPSAVYVTARIDSTVRIPADVRAVLQQATVLGDIYVALERSRTSAGTPATLSAGGRIPLAQTTSPPQLEDTIATLANFVASGSIQRMQNTVIRINRVTPEQTDKVRAIASRVSVNLKDLSDNIDTVDQWLNGVRGTADVLATSVPELQYWFSPAGMTEWDRMMTAAVGVGVLLPSVGSIYTGGFWLVPLLRSLGIAVGEVQKSKWAIEGEYKPWRQLFTDVFLPADKYPAMNITSIQTSDGREISGNVEDVLRMLGALP